MAARTRNRIEESLHIPAVPQDVAAVIEDPRKTPKWNPLVKELTLGKAKGRGLGSTVQWKAYVAGMTISGSSVATMWAPTRGYAWMNTDTATGLRFTGRFTLRPTHNGTLLSARVTYDLPAPLGKLVKHLGANRLLRAALRSALKNIRKTAAR